MIVRVSKCSDENERVEKTLNSITTLECTMVNTDILSPILKLNSSYIDKNYCEIPEFNRFYFIDSIETLYGGHCLIHCSVDVLMTYKEKIKGLSVYVERNEFDVNKLLIDSKLPISADKKLIVKRFGEEMSTVNTEYLIGVLGNRGE